MYRFLTIVLLLTATLNLRVAAASEFDSGWAGIPEAEVRLIAGHVPGHGDMLGLHFVLSPGWKTYWRSPGDAGLPPEPDWSASQGLSGAELAWPLPERFLYYGLVTYGYHDEIVLPVRLDRADGETRVRLNLSYAACAEVCVPIEAGLTLDLPPGPLPENRHSAAIAGALERTPAQSPPDLGLAGLTFDKGSLAVAFRAPHPLADPDLIVEGPRDVVFDHPQCENDGALTRCRVDVDTGGTDVDLTASPLRLTLSGDGYAAEMPVTVGKP